MAHALFPAPAPVHSQLLCSALSHPPFQAQQFLEFNNASFHFCVVEHCLKGKMFTVVILTKYSKDLLTPLEGKHPRGGASCWTPFQSAKAAAEPMEWKLLGERCTLAQPGLGSSGWKSGRWETSEQLQERHQDGLPAIIKP